MTPLISRATESAYKRRRAWSFERLLGACLEGDQAVVPDDQAADGWFFERPSQAETVASAREAEAAAARLTMQRAAQREESTRGRDGMRHRAGNR